MLQPQGTPSNIFISHLNLLDSPQVISLETLRNNKQYMLLKVNQAAFEVEWVSHLN